MSAVTLIVGRGLRCQCHLVPCRGAEICTAVVMVAEAVVQAIDEVSLQQFDSLVDIHLFAPHLDGASSCTRELLTHSL